MEIRPITQTIAANDPTVIGVGGRYLRVVDCDSPFVLEVGRGGQFTAKFPAAKIGTALRVPESKAAFDKVRITSTSQQDITIETSDGEVWQDGQDTDVSDRVGRLVGIVSVSGAAYTTATKSVTNVSAVLLAANASRRFLSIQNPATNPSSIWVRCNANPASADTNSIEIAPGETWEPPVAPTGELRAISGVAAGINVHVIEA